MMLHRFATIQKFAAGGPALPDRTIVAIASDATLDRAGDVMVASGCDATNYKRNAVVLRDHDPTKPIGTASVIVKGNRLEATIKFAPAGVSPVADETFALAKAGVLTGVSIGFRPIESEPLRGGGVKFTKWELLEDLHRRRPCQSLGPRHPAQLPRLGGRPARGKVWASGISAADQEHHAPGAEAPDGYGRMSRRRARRSPATPSIAPPSARRARQVPGAHGTGARAHEQARPAQAEPGDAIRTPRSRRDPDDDNELALAALRRKREIAVMERQIEAQDELYAALYPTPPRSFKVFDASRLVRAVISDESGAVQRRAPALERRRAQRFAKTRGVLVGHDPAKLVAWCADLEFCEGS